MVVGGVFLGLILAIVLVLFRWHAAYALLAGALAGALLGGASVGTATQAMILGIQNMAPAIIRVLTAGVLVGTLVSTGAAVSIADTIIDTLGEQHIHLALAISAALLTGIGIFMDVACVTIAPVALAAGKRLKISKISVLLALTGGCKVGNFISPNPPNIAVSAAFGVSIPSVMGINLIPGLAALALTVYVASRHAFRGAPITDHVESHDRASLPSFGASIIGPLTAIALLIPNPLFGSLDPLIALPTGGIVGLIAMLKLHRAVDCAREGLNRISGVVLSLLGIGAFAGVINASNVHELGVRLAETHRILPPVLAVAGGVFFSAASGSATAGALISCATFAKTLKADGVLPLIAASLISAGSVAFDHTPHGSFFNTSKEHLHMTLKERFGAYHWEILIGLSIPFFTVLYTAALGFFGR